MSPCRYEGTHLFYTEVILTDRNSLSDSQKKMKKKKKKAKYWIAFGHAGKHLASM